MRVDHADTTPGERSAQFTQAQRNSASSKLCCATVPQLCYIETYMAIQSAKQRGWRTHARAWGTTRGRGPLRGIIQTSMTHTFRPRDPYFLTKPSQAETDVSYVAHTFPGYRSNQHDTSI